MPIRHIMLTIVVVAVWGVNFVFAKYALMEIPPMTLGALRFFFTALPFVFFIPKPKVSWKTLIAYGVTNFAFQFAFMFSGMKMGMSPALASMIPQTQVFFTMAMAAFLLKERIHLLRIFGAIVAFSGIAIIGLHFDQEVTLIGLLLLLAGAFSWACGNIIAKSMGAINAFAIVVWGGLVAFPFLLVTALITEGPHSFMHLTDVSTLTIISVAYIVYGSTHLAYSLWSWLLVKHSASTVAPFSLLVPVFGYLSSSLMLGEDIPVWKISAGLLVVAGLCINIYASKKSTSQRLPSK